MDLELNSLKRLFPAAGLVAGRVTNNGTAAIHSLLGPEGIDRDVVTVVRNGAGDVSVTVKQFRGPRGVMFAFGNAETLEVMVNPVLPTYSGDNLTAQFKFEDDAGVATDTDFMFFILVG